MTFVPFSPDEQDEQKNKERTTLIPSQVIDATEAPKKRTFVPFTPEEQRQIRAESLREAWAESTKVDPDSYAKDATLAEKNHWPLWMVQRSDENRKQAEENIVQPDFDDLSENYPVTCDYLSMYQNMVVSKDDIENLKKTEGLFSRIGKAFMRGVSGTTDMNRFADLSYKERTLGLNEKEVEEFKNLTQKIHTPGNNEFLPVSGLGQQIMHQVIPFSRASRQLFPTLIAAGVLTSAGIGAAMPGTIAPGAAIGIGSAGALSTVGGIMGLLTKASVSKENVDYMMKLETEMLYRSMIDIKDEKGVPLSSYVDKDTMGLIANVFGGVTGLTEFFPMEFFLRFVPGLKGASSRAGVEAIMFHPTTRKALISFARNYLTSITLESAQEGIQEVISKGGEEYYKKVAQDLGVNVASDEAMEWVRAFGEEFITAAYSFSLSQMIGPGMGLVTDLHNVERAKIEKQVFLEISGAAKESKTKVRLPDAARQHVEMLTQNGPVETTYIDAEHFFQYFQEAGVDPMEVAKELGVEESDVTMALATEGRLAVPTSEYAVKVAGTEAGDALLDDVTFTPEGMTMREASAFMTEQKEIERRSVEAAEQLVARDEAIGKDLEYVKSSFMTQALAAGVDADVAEGNASLFEARAKAILGRYGINPREWYDRIGLQIAEGSLGVDADGASYNQDGAINLNDNFYKWFGDSKVVDEEGKPLIVYHTGTMDDSYDIAKSRSYNGSPDYEIPGIYLTADKQESQDYGSSGQTKELYVSIKNPYNEDTTALHDRLGTWRKVMDYLIEQGYDGVIDDESGEIIAFSPNQIKSVYNEGTWSPNNTNIYMQNQAEAQLQQDTKTWGETVDRALAGEINPRDQVPVMTTPLVFYLVGARVLPVKMDAGKIKKIRKEHNVTPELLKQIPMALAEPIAIFESQAGGKYRGLVAMLELQDKNGATVVAAMHLDRKGRVSKIDINKLASIYGKEKKGVPSDDWFARQIKTGNLLYLDKEKSSAWEYRTGILLPPAVTPNQDSSNKIIKTEADLVKLKQQFPSFYQGKARGSTSFSSRETVIRLFETSDRSTLLHETGHVFLEDLRSLALENKEAAADLKAVQDWLGVEDWATLTEEQRTEAHEKFARTFEAYLMNGEAPSEGLRRVFRNFRSWLVSIYKDIMGLSQEAGEDIALSDEAKDIFNRLLATDEEIEVARNMAGYETATETTLESLARHAIANGKAVEDVGKVPSAKDLKKRRLELTKQIKTEIEESRGYSTLNSMERAANKGGIKINEAEAIEVYGKEFVDQNLKPLGVLSKQSTWQMDELAVRFGYSSGDEMVRDLSTLPPINEVVKQQVDIMMEREAALSEGEAAGALRNDDRLEALAIEREDIAQKLKGEVEETKMPDWVKDMGEDASAKDVDVAVNDDSLPWLVWILGNDESLKYLRKRKRNLKKVLKESTAAFETDRSDDIRAQMVDLQNEIDYIAEADSILKETIKAAKEMSGETTNKPKRQEKVESSLRWEQVSVEEAINAAVTSPTAMASMKEAWSLAQRVSRLAFKEGSEEAKSRARDIKRQMREAVKQIAEAREQWRKDARAIAKSRAQAAKEIAGKVISEKLVYDIRPAMYMAAEKKAQRAIERALKANDFEEATRQKDIQILNAALVSESSKALQEIPVIERYLKRMSKKKFKRGYGVDNGYMQQIHTLLDGLYFGSRKKKAEAEVQSFMQWKKEQEDAGNIVVVPDRIIALAGKRHAKTLTLSELRDLKDSVKNINHLGNLKNKLLANSRVRDLEAAVDLIVKTVGENTKNPHDIVGENEHMADKVMSGLRSAHAAHTRMETLIRKLDGNKDCGPVWELFFKPFVDAQNDETVMTEAAQEAVKEIFGMLDVKGLHKEKYYPSIDWKLSKENLLSIALNWGNEGNRDRILQSKGWTEAQVEGLLAELTDSDWAFVQSMWDFLDSFWPAIAKLDKEMTGIEPKKVSALPFTTPSDIGMSGGYFPIKYDPRQNRKAWEFDEKKKLDNFMGCQIYRAQTQHGFTKTRLENVGRPVDLHLNVISEHVSEVIHDLTHRRAVRDVTLLLNDERVSESISKAVGPEMWREFKPWVQHIASGSYSPIGPWEKLLRRGRKGVTVGVLGFKITTSIMQFMSVFGAAERIGTAHMLNALQDFYKNPLQWKKKVDFVYSKSPEVRTRMTTFDRDIGDTVRNNTGRGKKGKVIAMMFYTHGLMDAAAVIPIWLEAYDMKLQETGNEKTAIYYADSVIRQTQPASNAKDLPSIMRGGELMKLSTMFYNYFSVLYNLFASRLGMTRAEGLKGLPKLAASFLWLVAVPAVLGQLATGRGPDDDDDWGEWLVGTIAMYPFQAVVGVRDLAAYVAKPQYGYSFSPAVRAIESVGSLIIQSKQALLDGDDWEDIISPALDVIGYWGQFPIYQAKITIGQLLLYMLGEESDWDISQLFIRKRKK